MVLTVVRDCAGRGGAGRVVVGQVKRPDVVVRVGPPVVRHRVVAAAEAVGGTQARSAGPVRLAAAASPRSSVVKSSIRWKRRRSVWRVKQGDGQTIRLARGASLTDLAEKIGVDAASLVQVLFHLGGDGDRYPVGER